MPISSGRPSATTPFPTSNSAFLNARKALQAYQLEDPNFHPYSSKFDLYAGNKIGGTLTPAETRGLKVFSDPNTGNCASCHYQGAGLNGSSALFTDFSYEAIGVPRNAAIAANADPGYFDIGLCGPLRADHPAAPGDGFCGMFKTPTLRNVATRKSFFHNGVMHSLEQVIRFYNTRDTMPEIWYPTVGGTPKAQARRGVSGLRPDHDAVRRRHGAEVQRPARAVCRQHRYADAARRPRRAQPAADVGAKHRRPDLLPEHVDRRLHSAGHAADLRRLHPADARPRRPAHETHPSSLASFAAPLPPYPLASRQPNRPPRFTRAMNTYLEKRGDLCLAKSSWPIDVTQHEIDIGARNAVQMPVLERLGAGERRRSPRSTSTTRARCTT